MDYKGKTMLSRQSWKDPETWSCTQRHAELLIIEQAGDWPDQLPSALTRHIKALSEREQNPVDYLDI
jgi:hypothetical protein